VTRTTAFKWMMILMSALALMTTACGPSQEELDDRDRQIAQLKTDLKNQKAADDAKVADLQIKIESLGGKLSDADTNATKMQEALAEYKTRADQLAAIEARFRALKAHLDSLTKIGLKVVVRNNRMVIQLPGDILFDSGKDELKPGGKDVLGQVADVIRNDKDLNSRNFQVAGHTDNAKYGTGPFHDNWGLSLARARQVLLFLIGPNAPGKPGAKGGSTGGGLDPKHWAASGYGDTDPIAGTMAQQSPADQQKNRRVELVVQPNVEEMLNLDAITSGK
jgi:chemotaxis protein MotB